MANKVYADAAGTLDRLILGAPYDKQIEFRTVRRREAA